MALNKFMHPRNRYKNNRPDFAKLGDKYPDFKPFLSYSDKGKATLDFKDPEALRALTCTLLKEDFDLDLDVPLDHIIPTVPLRLNYIHWLEDLLEGIPRTGGVWGIDIGCGTSCIYPLLGAKMNGWNFWALEVDPLALQYSRDNITRNQLGGQIQVIENTSGSLFLDLVNETSLSSPSKFHFTMCNPPFFGSALEAQGMLSSRSFNRSEPSSVSTADEVEMIVEGGEVDFVKRMIQESKQISKKVVWFTSMLGKKASVGQIVAELRRDKVPTWTTTEFCQGRTMRWGVAWSFLREAKKQQTPTKKHGKAKPPLSIPVLSEYITKLFQKTQDGSTAFDMKQKTQGRGRQEKVQAVAMAMEELMKNLQMTVTKQASTKWNPKFDLVANKNTWSHQRRKRRQAKMKRKMRDREEDNEMKASCTKPDVRVCRREAPHTAAMTNSRLKYNQDCSENITSEVKSETFSPGGGFNGVKLVTGGSDDCQNSCQSEQVGKDMKGEVNAQDTCYHGNHVAESMVGEEVNGLIESGESCEIVPHQKDVCKSTKHVKWKEDEISNVLNLEPARKRKKLNCGDGFTCSKTEEEGNATGAESDSDVTSNHSIRQRDRDTNHSQFILGNVMPAVSGLVQGGVCRDQSKEKSICDSSGVNLCTVQGELCQNEEVHGTMNTWADGTVECRSVITHQSEGKAGKSTEPDSMEIKVSSSLEANEGDSISTGQEGAVSHIRPRLSSSGHVHTPICMSSSDPGSSSEAESSGPLLRCLMEVKLATKGSVEVVFSCDSGQNRELLHQVAQYVKNHIARESKG